MRVKRLSLILSTVFHPLLLISLGSYFIFSLDKIYNLALDSKILWFYMLVIFLGTFVFPLNAVYWIRRFNREDTNMQMETQAARRLPLLIAAVFVLLTFYIFSYKIGDKAPHLLRGYLLGSSAAILVASMVNRWYKISLHAIGLGGVLGLLFYMQGSAIMDLRPLIVFWLLLSGIVCSARMYLGSHTISQIYTGFFTGVFLIYLIIRI